MFASFNPVQIVFFGTVHLIFAAHFPTSLLLCYFLLPFSPLHFQTFHFIISKWKYTVKSTHTVNFPKCYCLFNFILYFLLHTKYIPLNFNNPCTSLYTFQSLELKVFFFLLSSYHSYSLTMTRMLLIFCVF